MLHPSKILSSQRAAIPKHGLMVAAFHDRASFGFRTTEAYISACLHSTIGISPTSPERITPTHSAVRSDYNGTNQTATMPNRTMLTSNYCYGTITVPSRTL
jgi:hypothetical protein